MGVLTVKLVKATNLADKDLAGKTDPYVIMEIEQDNMLRDKDYGSQRSSTKSGETDPVWDEEFQFTIPTLNNMELSLKVFDDDVGRDDKCGNCKINLEKEGLSASPKRIERTIDRNLIRANGKIEVELSYEE
mmetsp:Transcript_5007/g.5780  ORF Transcript_5007/g.5780 Transcript_5007/m.5780 type:complete len:132 (+) Transcript_5007:64-459(+)